MDLDSGIVAVDAEVDNPVVESSGGNVQTRALRVRSKLGEELYGLIEPDLPSFYSKIRNAALGECSELPRDRRGNLPRSAGSFITNHRRMFLDLMKMANADVDVDSAAIDGDMDAFKQMIGGLTTQQIRELTEKGSE